MNTMHWSLAMSQYHIISLSQSASQPTYMLAESTYSSTCSKSLLHRSSVGLLSQCLYTDHPHRLSSRVYSCNSVQQHQSLLLYIM